MYSGSSGIDAILRLTGVLGFGFGLEMLVLSESTEAASSGVRFFFIAPTRCEHKLIRC